MKILKNLLFDGTCRKITALTGCAAAGLFLFELIGAGASGVSRYICMLMCDLSALSMLSLYFSMLAYAVCLAAAPRNGGADFLGASEKGAGIFRAMYIIAAALKLAFFLCACMSFDPDMIWIHVIALAAEFIPSRFCSLRLFETAQLSLLGELLKAFDEQTGELIRDYNSVLDSSDIARIAPAPAEIFREPMFFTDWSVPQRTNAPECLKIGYTGIEKRMREYVLDFAILLKRNISAHDCAADALRSAHENSATENSVHESGEQPSAAKI